MLARIRKATEENESGFTLIELLVVMIIIGILAAIAIPVFLNQRKSAVDTSARSDIKTVASEMETYFTDNQTYVVPTTSGTGKVTVGPTATGNEVKMSKDNTVSGVLLSDAGTVAAAGTAITGFCLSITNPNGTKTKISGAGGINYNSLDGGLTTKKCP